MKDTEKESSSPREGSNTVDTVGSISTLGIGIRSSNKYNVSYVVEGQSNDDEQCLSIANDMEDPLWISENVRKAAFEYNNCLAVQYEKSLNMDNENDIGMRDNEAIADASSEIVEHYDSVTSLSMAIRMIMFAANEKKH